MLLHEAINKSKTRRAIAVRTTRGGVATNTTLIVICPSNTLEARTFRYGPNGKKLADRCSFSEEISGYDDWQPEEEKK